MALEHDSNTPLGEAVRRAGSQSAFARIVGRRQSTIFFWLANGRPLPGELVIVVEEATGVSRHLLRPDLYPSDALPTPRGVSDGGAIVLSDRAAISQRASA